MIVDRVLVVETLKMYRLQCEHTLEFLRARVFITFECILCKTKV